MQAFLDGAPLALERATFAAAIRAGQQQAQERGRVVSEVFLDGIPVAVAILRHPPEAALGREVRMVSMAAPAGARGRGEAGGRLDEALQALEHAVESQSRAASLVRTAKVEQALIPLSEAVRNWHAVQRIAVEELTWAADSEAFRAIVEDLSATLREVHRSLEQQDWSALGDVLAYDMKAQAEGWRVLLEGLAHHAGAAAGAKRP